MGVLMRRVLDGDEKVAEWSAEDPASIDAARRLLQRELDAGYIGGARRDGDNEPSRSCRADADVGDPHDADGRWLARTRIAVLGAGAMGAEKVGDHKQSTLQDLEAGKPLELAGLLAKTLGVG